MPKWSACGKYIAYVKREILPETDLKTGKYNLQIDEIWICDANGENKKKLSGEYHFGGEYLWSPNSKYIVFEGEKYPPEGGCVVCLLSVEVESGKIFLIDSFPCWEADFHFSISPDGRMVVYTKPLEADHRGPTRSELFVADIDGSYKKQLTNTPDKREWFVKWLPDGRSVLLRRFDLKTKKMEWVKLILKKVSE